MRLKALEISGFRGFASEQSFDLDADAIIIVGTNGNGKTSLFDAILWAISGRIPRLADRDTQLVSRFGGTGQARVVLRLGEAGENSDVSITRVFDGEKTNVRVESARGVFNGPQADGAIIELIWQDAATSAQPGDALASVLTRCVYLQQDLVRQFIESATVEERFLAVSELVGAGRITELQAKLENQKKAWTKVTNERSAELQPMRTRLATMESRIAELRTRPTTADGLLSEATWNAWWLQLRSFGLGIEPVAMDVRDAPGAIDSAIKTLDGLRRAAERRQQVLAALQADLAALAATPRPDPSPLREQVSNLKRRVDEARASVSTEQARVAELRRLQAELREQSEQLRALAGLALKHLDERCPVCQQQYDVEATRRRLEGLSSGRTGAQNPLPPEALPGLLAQLADAEKALAAAELQLRVSEQAMRGRDATESASEKRLEELGLKLTPTEDRSAVVGRAQAEVLRQIEAIVSAQSAGEAFALRLARTGEQAVLQELERESREVRAKLQKDDEELRRRAATGEQAQGIIEALRDATSETVREQIKAIEPLLGDIYSRIDAHPAFRAVSFLTEVVKGRGRLSTVVSDPLSAVECDVPNLVLSSSQMNALAVCTFLSLNLGVARPPIATAILDDPLQSLDDINLLGLIDLLRRTKDQRQLCVSTHDVRFGDLLERKLRPGSSNQRTTVIRLDGWTRLGPTVSVHDVSCDPAPLRLVAS